MIVLGLKVDEEALRIAAHKLERAQLNALDTSAKTKKIKPIHSWKRKFR